MEGGEGKGVAVLLLLVVGMESAGGCGVRGWERGLQSSGDVLGRSVQLPMGTAGLGSGLRQGEVKSNFVAFGRLFHLLEPHFSVKYAEWAAT